MVQPRETEGKDEGAPGPVSRLLAELGEAPERDPRLPRLETLRPGDVVGRFELLREAGRGGFGVVFEARDPELDRSVAVKTIRRGARLGPASESLAREIEAGRLRHPNIQTVLGSGRCERGPYVVFEYLSGETLGERLARGPLHARQAVGVAVAVARALAHAHAQGVLHRDIKPANVFLPSAGGAKVVDFGLASVPGSGGPRGSGTSRYMSPEQRRGDPEDARTDLFALGLVVQEMVTGIAPPGREGACRRRTPDSRAARIPVALDRIVADLVEHDPDLRPRSADEVLARLLAVQRRLDAGVTRRCRSAGRAAGGARRERARRRDRRSTATGRRSRIFPTRRGGGDVAASDEQRGGEP